MSCKALLLILLVRHRINHLSMEAGVIDGARFETLLAMDHRAGMIFSHDRFDAGETAAAPPSDP